MGLSVAFSLEDLVLGLAVVAAVMGGAVFHFYGRRGGEEARVLLAALVFKLASCLLYSFLIVRVLGGGDSVGYHRDGVMLAETLRNDLLWGSANYLEYDPFFLPPGSSTDHMTSLSGLVHFLLLDSFLACSLFFAVVGFAGQVLTYRTFAARYPDPRLRRWWRAGILFFPTVTFWTAGMLKDSVGMWGLGLSLWGVHRFLERPRPGAFLAFAVGVYTLIQFRLQVVPVLFVALVPWMMQSQGVRARLRGWSARHRGSPWLRVGLAAAVLVGVGLAGRLEKRYSLSSIPQAIALQSGAYEQIGGATIEVFAAPSWGGLLAATPGALVVSLFRPFAWEAPGVLGLLAAAENTVLLLLTVRAVAQLRRRRGALREVLRAPMFLTCLVFVVLFGIGVGASTPNLGTVSRYRVPLLPFFVGMLAIVEYQGMEARRRRERPQAPAAVPEHAAA